MTVPPVWVHSFWAAGAGEGAHVKSMRHYWRKAAYIPDLAGFSAARKSRLRGQRTLDRGAGYSVARTPPGARRGTWAAAPGTALPRQQPAASGPPATHPAPRPVARSCPSRPALHGELPGEAVELVHPGRGDRPGGHRVRQPGVPGQEAYLPHRGFRVAGLQSGHRRQPGRGGAVPGGREIELEFSYFSSPARIIVDYILHSRAVDQRDAVSHTASCRNGPLQVQRGDADLPVAPADRLQAVRRGRAIVGDLRFVRVGCDAAHPFDAGMQESAAPPLADRPAGWANRLDKPVRQYCAAVTASASATTRSRSRGMTATPLTARAALPHSHQSTTPGSSLRHTASSAACQGTAVMPTY